MTDSTKQKKARVIAFYLPQFHPIPENDAWWGKGFTEWTNVAKARPLFKDHEQPHLPADLGFYDLRLPETRAAQAELAAAHGIEGFCYWHYWFGGRRLLERPFNEVLSSGEPNFPFCLGWANESWTGVWNNEPKRMLLEQTYPGDSDDRAHFDYLIQAFKDPRYITVDDKPLFFIYKPLKLPDAKRRLNQWREWAVQAGFKGLYILGNNMLDFNDAEELGLDGAVISTLGIITTKNPVIEKLKWLFWGVNKTLNLSGPRTIEYKEAINYLIPDLSKYSFNAYPCAYPNWDHTPRSGRKGLALTGSTPELFEQHMTDALDSIKNRDKDHRIIFLKSWNEWAEGNYLEPDSKWGNAYLKALSKVIY
jgi:hypothetical protein